MTCALVNLFLVRKTTAVYDGGVVCPETAAALPRSRSTAHLLSCIKPLDAFTSGAERLQSELVQTFPNCIHIDRNP